MSSYCHISVCPELCATCTDHDTCVACDVTSYMSDGACYSKCFVKLCVK